MIQGLVSVVMLTKDPLQEYTQKAIKCLQASTVDYELILINRNKKWSVGTATNQGLEAAIGDRILLLCDDCFVEPDTLEQLRDELRLKDVGMVGPSLHQPGSQDQAAGLALLYRENGKQRSIRSLNDDIYYPDDMKFLSGACLMFRRSVLDEIGGYAPDCKLGGGDLDYCFRTRIAGYTLRLVESTSAVHLVGSTRKQHDDKAVMEVEGMNWLMNRWRGTEYVEVTGSRKETLDHWIGVGKIGRDTKDRLLKLLEQEAPDGSD